MSGGGMMTRIERYYAAQQHMVDQKQRIEAAWYTAFESLPTAIRERLVSTVRSLQVAELAYADGKLAFESLPRRTGAAWERHLADRGAEVDDLARTLGEAQAAFILVCEQCGERLCKVAQAQESAALEAWEQAKAAHEAMVAESKANVFRLFWLHQAINDVTSGAKDPEIVEVRADAFVATLDTRGEVR